MPVHMLCYTTLAGLAIGFSFMNIPPVADQFMALFGVGYGGLSLFLSGLLWAHALMQIPAGLLVDHLGVFKCALLSSGIGVAAGLAPFAAPDDLALAVATRFGLGVCTSVLFLCVLKIIALLAPPERMARAQGTYGATFGFGTMLPYFVLPYLGESAWRCAYLLSAAMYAGILLFTVLLPRAYLTVRRAEGDAPGVRAVLVAALLSRPMWILGLVHGLSYGTLNNLGQWMSPILADLSGSPLAAWTLATTLVILVGSASRFASGHLTRLASHAAIISGSLLSIFIFYCLLGLAGSAGPALVFGLALAVSAGANYGALFTMGSRALTAACMGTGLGLLNTVANLFNVGLTLLYGNVREHTGSFSWASLAAAAVALIACAAFRKPLAEIDRLAEHRIRESAS